MKDKLRELVKELRFRVPADVPNSPRILMREWCADRVEAILDAEGDGGAVGCFSMPQSFVARATNSDEDEPPVMGAGCVDSIKRVAEEMVSACKAERQGDAEFTHEAVDDWAHRIMCFANYVSPHPARSGVVSDEDVDAACRVNYESDGNSKWDKLAECWKIKHREAMRAALEHFAKGERHGR